MKNFVLALFLLFSLFAACNLYAATNTLTVQQIPSNASFKALSLQKNPNVTCASSTNNVGILYMNSTSNNLELCAVTYINANNNPQASPSSVPYLATCLNRFWSVTNAPCPNSPPGGCPTVNGVAFTQAMQGNPATPMVDTFKTASSAGVDYYGCSTVCCNPYITPAS